MNSIRRNTIICCAKISYGCPEMEKVRLWSTEMTVGRDKSHSIEHFGRVESFIKNIIQDENVKSQLAKINSQNFEAEKILFSAAWLHDIFDHKYTTEEEAKAGQLKIKSFLENIEFHSGELEPGTPRVLSWITFCVN